MSLNPLHQFAVHEVASLDIFGQTVSLTNQNLSVSIGLAFVVALFLFGSSKPKMIPGRLQAFVELTVTFIQTMVKDTAGAAALKFLPLILTLFLFISSLNLIGIVPVAFTATSQIFVCGVLGISMLAIVVAAGFYLHGLKFLSVFLPSGTPWWLAPLIIVLEMISFFARPFTLAIRLTANMVAGHMLLKIFASFVVMLIGAFGVGVGVAAGVLPGFMILAITGLEVFVALLQAYIFTVLVCVYLNDAIHLH